MDDSDKFTSESSSKSHITSYLGPQYLKPDPSPQTELTVSVNYWKSNMPRITESPPTKSFIFVGPETIRLSGLM